MKLHRKDIQDDIGIDLTVKDGSPGHKHKPDMDKGSYELRVEHDQDTDGAINIDDVMGVLSISRGITQTTSDEHELAADWNGDGSPDILMSDVLGRHIYYQNDSNLYPPKFHAGKELWFDNKPLKTVWRVRPAVVDWSLRRTTLFLP